MTEKIPLIMDDRECRGPMPGILERHGGFDISIERLIAGDYRVDQRFLFERKTLPDLVQSIISGRLFKQALRLVEVPGMQSALILEGTSQDLRGSEMCWEAVQGALINVSLLIGLPVLRARTPEETVKTMAFAANQARTLTAGGLPRKGYRPKGKAALQRYVLQGLPGVGPARADQLVRRFGSVRAVMAATPDALLDVDGIGQETANRIDWTVRDSLQSYGNRIATFRDDCGDQR